MAFHIVQVTGLMGAVHWEVRQEVKQHGAGALMHLAEGTSCSEKPFSRGQAVLLGISVWQKGHLSDALEVPSQNCQ